MKIISCRFCFRIIIRFRCDSENADINLGLKYGCDPKHEAIKLIHLTKSLGLTLYGFSFHVGSPCGDLAAYAQGIRIAEKLIGYAKSVGCYEANLIDIGGGFPGESDYDFNQVNILQRNDKKVTKKCKRMV